MKNMNMTPLVFNTQELPLVKWDSDTATIIICHGQRGQYPVKIHFDGVKDFSCPRTEEYINRKSFMPYETKIYTRTGKIAATYQQKQNRLTIWHEGMTTIVFLPRHTTMWYEN